MSKDYPYELLDDPVALAELGEWEQEVYRDFSRFRVGELTEAELKKKYLARVAILCLDMTGFTQAAIKMGEAMSLIRIFDVQRVCLPIFRQDNARLVRAFADDLTALFDNPNQALDAAIEVHKRIAVFNQSNLATPHPAECCIGIGFGDVFAIGPNLAMGDEMNRASKLGEDTARAGEILVTENMYQEIRHRTDCEIREVSTDDLPFPYYSVSLKTP